MNVDLYDWLIAIANSAADGVAIFKFRGTKDEVKEKLLSLIKKDRSNDTENWSYGCECVEDLTSLDNGLGYEWSGYATYSEYHIDYVAKELSYIQII